MPFMKTGDRLEPVDDPASERTERAALAAAPQSSTEGNAAPEAAPTIENLISEAEAIAADYENHRLALQAARRAFRRLVDSRERFHPTFRQPLNSVLVEMLHNESIGFSTREAVAKIRVIAARPARLDPVGAA